MLLLLRIAMGFLLVVMLLLLYDDVDMDVGDMDLNIELEFIVRLIMSSSLANFFNKSSTLECR